MVRIHCLKPLLWSIALAAGLGLSPVSWAQDAAQGTASTGGFYMGVLGGLGSSHATSLRQRGTVLLPHPLPNLPIDAAGDTDTQRLGMGGIQLGYEWDGLRPGQGQWGWRPAVELEGLYLGKHTPKGTMPVHPAFLGTQYVTVPTRGYLLMANGVMALETPYSRRFFPYLGLGVGVARLSISGADSANPLEPGINHFNAGSSAHGTAFAYQVRLGIRGQLTPALSVFTEYRHLGIARSRYTFGRTDYPGEHPPTDRWDVRMGRLKYDMFVVGLQYRF